MNHNIHDVIKFGSYPQKDANASDPIEWIILDIDNDRLLLLSKYVLDAKPYNDTLTDIVWRDCTLRQWLNNKFYTDAFSGSEKKAICEVKIHNADNNHPLRVNFNGLTSGRSNTVLGGGDTVDKIFLLSYEEGRKYFKPCKNKDKLLAPILPTISRYIPNASQEDINNIALALNGLRAEATPYAKKHNAYITDGNSAWWWFRSPGNTSQMATGTMGDILYHVGCEVDDGTYGIRPALWIKKDFLDTDVEKSATDSNKQKDVLSAERKKQGVCVYCGGKFKGIFNKRCRECGKPKNY